MEIPPVPTPVFPELSDSYGHWLFANVRDFLRIRTADSPCFVDDIVAAFTHPHYQDDNRRRLLRLRIYTTLETLRKNNSIEVENIPLENNLSLKSIRFIRNI